MYLLIYYSCNMYTSLVRQAEEIMNIWIVFVPIDLILFYLMYNVILLSNLFDSFIYDLPEDDFLEIEMYCKFYFWIKISKNKKKELIGVFNIKKALKLNKCLMDVM